jgi:hypothetical protein
MSAAGKNTQSKKSKVENVIEDVLGSVNVNNDGIGGMIGNASRIVFKAAGILEEEIARGIIAARQVEEKYTDVPKLRAGKGGVENKQLEELLVRFRKDAHDIIDMVIDFAAIAANNAEKISSRIINIRQENNGSTSYPSTPPTQVPLIQVPGELKRGQETEVPLLLENDNKEESKTLSFINSPFTSSAGDQLPSSILLFTPNPLIIPAASRGSVNIKLTVPADAKPGTYTSFLEARNIESLKATIMIKIAG